MRVGDDVLLSQTRCADLMSGPRLSGGVPTSGWLSGSTWRRRVLWPMRRQRSELNAARTSAVKSSGSSQAGKWPPLSTSLKYERLG
jgi:hypothetical protein